MDVVHYPFSNSNIIDWPACIMSAFLGHPGIRFGGTYRVKVYNSNRDLYWKYVPGSQRVQLATFDESEESPGLLFKWHIVLNTSFTAFTIRPAYKPDFSLQRDVDGRPKGKEGSHLDWLITSNNSESAYSSIKLDDHNIPEVLGCSDTTAIRLIDFELPEDDNKNQRFVFQFVEARRAHYSPAFGYGSNLWDEQMKNRCPDNVFGCIAKLDGWKWIINDRPTGGVATIIPSPNDHVWGTVLLLHEHDEKALDREEGKSYVKSNLLVDLKGVRKNPGPVLTYINKVPKPGTPNEAYIRKLKYAMADGKAKGIPQEYFETYWKPFVPSLFPPRN